MSNKTIRKRKGGTRAQSANVKRRTNVLTSKRRARSAPKILKNKISNTKRNRNLAISSVTDKRNIPKEINQLILNQVGEYEKQQDMYDALELSNELLKYDRREIINNPTEATSLIQRRANSIFVELQRINDRPRLKRLGDALKMATSMNPENFGDTYTGLGYGRLKVTEKKGSKSLFPQHFMISDNTAFAVF